MADFEVSVKVNKDEVRKIVGRLRDVGPPLQTMAREKMQAIEKQFQSNTDPDGQAWASLKPSTLKSKRVNRDKILTRTGRMRAAFTLELTKNTLDIRNNTPYAVYHQYGTRKMARRLILKWTDKERERLRKLVRTWVNGRK